MAGRAIINGRGTIFVVLGDMRGDGVFSQGDNELFGVISLIRAQGFTPRRLCCHGFDHGFCRFPLSGAGGFGHLSGNNQTVAILHQHMPHVRQIGPVILALAIEPCIRIGHRLVSGVGEFLPVKIDLIVAPNRPLGRAIFRTKAFDRSPGLKQGAVNGEVLVGEQPLFVGLFQNGGKKLSRNFRLEQTRLILCENGGIQAFSSIAISRNQRNRML